MSPRLPSPKAARVARATRFAALACLALGVSACERGCLATWLAERSGNRGTGVEGPRSLGDPDGAASSFDLGGTDCSGGLARCVGGRIESSLTGHVPYPCSAGEKSGACECAWQAHEPCPAGCVQEKLEVVASAEVARAQLCAPTEPAFRPLLPSELATVLICADQSLSCVDGIVRSCEAPGQPVRMVAACVSGCATGIVLDQGDVRTNDGAAAILCRRAHAEHQ